MLAAATPSVVLEAAEIELVGVVLVVVVGVVDVADIVVVVDALTVVVVVVVVVDVVVVLGIAVVFKVVGGRGSFNLASKEKCPPPANSISNVLAFASDRVVRSMRILSSSNTVSSSPVWSCSRPP